jgi:hypothetical protein
MILSIFLSLFFTIGEQCTPIRTVRREYHKIENKEDLAHFISITKKNEKCNKIKPYYASAVMQQAKYAVWPGKKLKYFKEGKNLLEAFIEKNNEHIEAKYIRVLVQNNTPSFLNYDDNIQEDITFILKNIDDYKIDESYKKLILKNVRSVLKKEQQ